MNILLTSEHGHSENFWEDFIAIATDPAHLAFEFVFSIFFDLIIITLVYGVIVKKYVIPRLRKQIHKEIDAEHGIEH